MRAAVFILLIFLVAVTYAASCGVWAFLAAPG